MSQIIQDDGVCPLDGITFFVRDPVLLHHLYENSRKYALKDSYIIETGKVTPHVEGRFENFVFRTNANSRGVGIEFGGSLHKWKNKTHNHDTFLRSDLLVVLNQLLHEFNFDPQLTDIWVVEAGLNNILPAEWKFKAKDFPLNTILLNGKPKSNHVDRYTKDGISLKLTKGECTLKLYDKGAQFNLDHEVLRTECSCKCIHRSMVTPHSETWYPPVPIMVTPPLSS